MVTGDVPLLSWLFTVLATLVLILMLIFSFVRFRRRRQVKRNREEEYAAMFNIILPGCSYREMKKTLARKIMTNTHAVSIADVSMTPVSSTSSIPRLFTQKHPKPEPSSSDDVLGGTQPAMVSVHNPPTMFDPHRKGTLPGILKGHRNATVPTVKSRRAEFLSSQNSNDTTTDEERPLMPSGSMQSPAESLASPVRQQHVNTMNETEALHPRKADRTTTKDMHGKRTTKIQPEFEQHQQTSGFAVKSDFTTSLGFADKQKTNYIVYTPNLNNHRSRSVASMGAFAEAEDDLASSSAPNISISNYQIDDDVTHTKVRPKSGKGHRKGQKPHKHGKKHSKSGNTYERARSLPHLDNVYYTHVIDDVVTNNDDVNDEDGSRAAHHSPSVDIDRAFIRRKLPVNSPATSRSDSAIQLSSFPLISQSDEVDEKQGYFPSEYM